MTVSYKEVVDVKKLTSGEVGDVAKNVKNGNYEKRRRPCLFERLDGVLCLSQRC
jgi:hypothetical protein